MSNVIHWGILGHANIAKKALLPALAKADHANIYAIASRRSGVEETAKAFHIDKTYTSYDALLDDEQIDAVYIPLPNGLHAEWTEKAAKAGKHVLCEKPAALTAQEAQHMVTVCQQHGVLFMEAFMYQFHSQHDKVRQLIREGYIGDVKMMRLRFAFALHDVTNVRFDKKLGGGALYDVGCYCIHASRYILGQEPHDIYAKGHVDHESGIDVTTSGLLTFPADVTVLFHASFEAFPEEGYEVIGSTGRIHVKHPFRPDKSPDGAAKIVWETADGTRDVLSLAGDAYSQQVEHFSQCILQGLEPQNTGTATVNNMKVIDACYHSMATGERVQLT